MRAEICMNTRMNFLCSGLLLAMWSPGCGPTHESATGPAAGLPATVVLFAPSMTEAACVLGYSDKIVEDRAKTLVEMAEGAHFYFIAPEAYDEAAAAKFLTLEQRPVLELLIKHLGALSSFELADIESSFKALMEESGLKLGKIGPVVRVALTGGTVSPSIYDVVSVLGQDAVMARLNKALLFLD